MPHLLLPAAAPHTCHDWLNKHQRDPGPAIYISTIIQLQQLAVHVCNVLPQHVLESYTFVPITDRLSALIMLCCVFMQVRAEMMETAPLLPPKPHLTIITGNKMPNRLASSVLHPGGRPAMAEP